MRRRSALERPDLLTGRAGGRVCGVDLRRGLGRADRTLEGVRKCILHAVWNAQGKEARTLARVAKPLVCIRTMPRIPAMQPPATMPTASSSRAVAKVVKKGSAWTASINGRSTLSGT